MDLAIVLVIVRDDKPYRLQVTMAEGEPRDKHKATNAALYGKLGYVLLLANAGDCVKVFAKGLQASDPLVKLQEITVRMCQSNLSIYLAS